MVILLFGVIFQIICGIYATNTTNLDYCEMQAQDFCGSRPHLLCNSSSKFIRDTSRRMDKYFKGIVMTQLMSCRDNALQHEWDDELEVTSIALSEKEDPNKYCMSTRNFIDVKSVVVTMYCVDLAAICNITEDPFEKNDGKILNIGCDVKLVIHEEMNETYTLVCLYNTSNRLTSDEYIHLSSNIPSVNDISDAGGIFNVYAIWLILAATVFIMTAN